MKSFEVVEFFENELKKQLKNYYNEVYNDLLEEISLLNKESKVLLKNKFLYKIENYAGMYRAREITAEHFNLDFKMVGYFLYDYNENEINNSYIKNGGDDVDYSETVDNQIIDLVYAFYQRSFIGIRAKRFIDYKISKIKTLQDDLNSNLVVNQVETKRLNKI